MNGWLKGPVPHTQKHGNIVGIARYGGQVQDMVAVEIPSRKRSDTCLRIQHRLLEGPVAPAQQNGNVLGSGIRGSQVEIAVAVEIAFQEENGIATANREPRTQVLKHP